MPTKKEKKIKGLVRFSQQNGIFFIFSSSQAKRQNINKQTNEHGQHSDTHIFSELWSEMI